MNRFFSSVLLLALTGCCSYSQLKRDLAMTRVDGELPVATYEVVNVSYLIFGFIPFSTGETWKSGPYSADVGSMTLLKDHCNLDDNMDSVRHACSIVGASRLSNVTGRVDDFWAWSCCLVKKRIVKTSCVILR